MRAAYLGLAFTLLSFTAPALAGTDEPPALTPPGAAAPVTVAATSGPPGATAPITAPPTAPVTAPAPVVAPAPRRIRPPYATGPSTVAPLALTAQTGGAAGANAPADFRIGVDGSVALGAFAFSTLSLRMETEVKPGGNFLLRLGYLRGSALEDEGDGFDGGMALLGYRSYGADGNAFVGFAGGIIAARSRAYLYEGDDHQGAEWTVLPDLSAGAGVKLGPIELGLDFSIPLFAIGINLGLELSAASLPAGSTTPSKPGVPRRRVQYR